MIEKISASKGCQFVLQHLPSPKQVRIVALALTPILALGAVFIYFWQTGGKTSQALVGRDGRDKESQVEGTKLKDLSASYKLETVVGKIRELKSQGKRINLIMGRSLLDTVPQNNDREVFVSLHSDFTLNYADKLDDTIIPKDRLHLKVDWAVTEDRDTLKNLFDYIIVDLNHLTTYIEYPTMQEEWRKLRNLLASPDSECITPLPNLYESRAYSPNINRAIERVFASREYVINQPYPQSSQNTPMDFLRLKGQKHSNNNKN